MPARAQPEDRAVGLFTRADAFDAGLTGDALSHRVRTGRLIRLQRGVYLESGTMLVPLARARAALLAAKPGAVVSGTTAARVWGWAPVYDGAEILTIARSEGHRVARPTLRWIRQDLLDDEIDESFGIQVTSRARTLADVLLRWSEADAMWIADQALRCDERLAELARPLLVGRHAQRALHRLEAAEPRSESPLETLARLMLRRHGFPVVVQHPVRDNAGRIVANADLALDELRIAIEGDGSGPHSTPDALFRDRRRQNLLVGLGWTVLRFTWRDITQNEAGVVAEVRAAVDRAHAAGREVDGFVSRKVGS